MAKIALAVGAGVATGLTMGIAGYPIAIAMEGALSAGSIGLAVGGLLFPPKIPGLVPLQDRQVSSSADGAPIPFGYGTGRVAGQVIWCPGIEYYTVGNAGKGGGTAAGLEYYYLASIAAAFGEGPATIEKIWADSNIIYDGGADFGAFCPWNADTTYQPEQLVSYQWNPGTGQVTDIFRCVIANTDIPPAGNSLYWVLSGFPYYNDLEESIQYYPGNQVAFPGQSNTAPTCGEIYTCVNPCLDVMPQPASDWQTMSEYYVVPTFYSGSQDQDADPTIQGNNGVDATPAFRGICYCVWENLPLATFGNRIPNLRAQINYTSGEASPDVSQPTIDQILMDLCTRSGLAETDVDISLMTAENVYPENQIFGFVCEHPSTAADHIKQLVPAYFFGACESDGVLRFVPRTILTDASGSPVTPFTIAENDLGLFEDKGKLEETFGQEQDLPLIETVLYNDVALNWQQGKQVKQRCARTVNTKQQHMLSMPLSLSDTDARQIAEATLYSAWTNRRSFKLNLLRALYMLLDPTDIIDMIYEGTPIEIRLVSKTEGQGYAVSVQAVQEDVRNYGSVVAGVSNEAFQPGQVAAASPTILL